MSGVKRSRDYGKRTTAVVNAKATVRGCFASVWTLVVFACLCGGAAPAAAQTTPSFTAAAAYNAQPGTAPHGVATGVFNNAGAQLDFAVLEQNPNGSSDQVEIFHGKNDGTFCTNCTNANPNPDVIPLGNNVKGNSIAVGQFRSAGPLDIAVATSTGIAFLQNNGSGTFALSSNAISVAGGFVSLAVGLFNGASDYDLAAVSPAVSGAVSFTVFLGDGTGAFPTQSSPYAVSNTYSQCTATKTGNFQGQTTAGADLALLCNNPSLASVLVYLNSGSGAFTLNQTLNAGNSFGGTLPGFAVGTLNSQAAIFISPISSSFISYQGNGLAGVNNAFTSISMIPVGLAPRGSLAVVNDPQTGAVDFASVNAGVRVSTFTSYTQSGASVNGTWSSTASLGPVGQVLAAGYSPNLTQGATYVVVEAGVHDGSYADPNVQGPPNFEPYVDERSIGVFLVTLNTDGTVAATNAAPIYSGTGTNGYSAPPSFATGDFNGDGKMDLAVGGADLATGDATLEIYLANPDGTLPVPPTTSLPLVTVNNTNYSGTDAVAAGKFRAPQNGKILYDLAVFSFGQINIFTSNGDGTFGTGNSYPLSADPNYPGFTYTPIGSHPFAPVLTAADVNGDGMDDLVLTLPEDNCKGSGSASQGAVYILISNGDGTFHIPVFVAPPVVNPVSVAAAKFFGTGVPDLVFADGGELCGGNTTTTTGTAVGILQNKVPLNSTSIISSEFTPAAILTQSSDLGVPDVTAVSSADLNGDGRPDLVISGTNGIQVLLNQGAGSFLPTTQGVLPLYAGDVIPGPLCNNADNYVGCVTYDSQLTTGSFFSSGETDVAAAVNGVVYIFQNQGSSGTLLSPTQGFVAGPDSGMISAALTGAGGLNELLVATPQGTAYLVNSGASGGPPFANYSAIGPIGFVTNANTIATQQLVLTNTGGIPFTISNISTSGIDSSFSVSNVVCNGVTDFPFSAPVNLGIAQSCTITIQFAPTAYGNGHADLLTVLDTAANSNAAASPQNNGQSFLLTGDATEPFATFSPTALSFGSVTDGTAVTQTVTVTNTGNGPLVLDLVTIAPLGTGFSYTQVVCNAVTKPSSIPWPLTLSPGSPGGYCTFTVQFDPNALGALSGGLGFADNAGVGQTNLPSTTINASTFQQIVSLSGTGVSAGPPPPAIVTDNETISVTDTVTFPDVVDTEKITVTDTVMVTVSGRTKTSATTTAIASTSTSFDGFSLPTNFALVGTTQVSVNFTVKPTSGSASPTGTVTVTDGFNDTCSETLTSASAGAGSCALTISQVGSGSTSLTAAYTPDSNATSNGLLASSSSAVTENVVQIVSCGVPPAATTVSEGATTTISFTVCLAGDVNAVPTAVTSNCLTNATCTLTVTPVAGKAGAYTVTLSVATSAGSVLMRNPQPRSGPWPVVLFALSMLLFLWMGFLLARHPGGRLRLVYSAGLLLALALAGISGCTSASLTGPSNNNGGTPLGAFSIKVNVTAGNFSLIVPVSVTVTK